MCGIVGAVSHKNIVDILVEGLLRLEYRGYDYCGFIATNSKESCSPIKGAWTTRHVWKLAKQEKDFFRILGNAYSIWAIGGKPNK